MIRLTQQDIDRWHDEFADDDEDRAAHDGKAIEITQEKMDVIAKDIAKRQFESDPDADTIDSGIVLDVLGAHDVHPAFEDKIVGVQDLIDEVKAAATTLRR